MLAAISVWRPLDSKRLPIVSGIVAAPNFSAKSLVFVAASQTVGMMPTKVHIPANHMPEKPTL
ncbi:MAG: hypothetical protein A4E62_01796 [Syntrophorhabdus sp. PtaU1.Bin002]|nr:MAG: hypothetical protein A4E62_01796 [Syntrophorhabdus sp. PtaU1.Bin002]OPY70141.1 MAG: hypothetical protein A4E63_01727 [Syntrophorhabdus sp. PtaU1.Bin050]